MFNRYPTSHSKLNSDSYWQETRVFFSENSAQKEYTSSDKQASFVHFPVTDNSGSDKIYQISKSYLIQ